MAQAPIPPTGNPLADIALQLGSKLFMAKMLEPKKRKRKPPKVSIAMGRRMRDYIPELDRYARGGRRF